MRRIAWSLASPMLHAAAEAWCAGLTGGLPRRPHPAPSRESTQHCCLLSAVLRHLQGQQPGQHALTLEVTMYQCREGASLPSPECETAVLRTLLERLAALPEVQARWQAAGGSNSEGRGNWMHWLKEGRESMGWERSEGMHGLRKGELDAWAAWAPGAAPRQRGAGAPCAMLWELPVCAASVCCAVHAVLWGPPACGGVSTGAGAGPA